MASDLIGNARIARNTMSEVAVMVACELMIGCS
jgi:hypothetical protein